MIERNIDIGLGRQCELLGIHRSGLYYAPLPESEDNLKYMRLFDEQYLKTPFYGIRRMTRWLNKKGFKVNRKKSHPTYEQDGLADTIPQAKYKLENKENKIYPYLLKDLKIDHPNQVWGINITYVPMRRGFMYLCAIIDLHTRYVVNWGISNSMMADWCCQMVEEAIEIHGKPEIINSDQGSQFTSMEYTEMLLSKGIKISMDGKGWAIENIFIERLWKSVTYECIYLHAFQDGVQLYEGLDNYFTFYNTERLHQSLDYETLESLYKKAA
jgi:putative transposase